ALRRPCHDRSSAAEAGGCLCRDHSRSRLQARRACELRRDRAADEGWVAEVQGLPGRLRWQRRDGEGALETHSIVMAGLDPAIHASSFWMMDARLKAGHDALLG